jgi:hypothetical protein
MSGHIAFYKRNQKCIQERSEKWKGIYHLEDLDIAGKNI